MKIRSDEEMDELALKCASVIDVQGTAFPGLSYEDGVIDTLAWLAGDLDDSPMELA